MKILHFNLVSPIYYLPQNNADPFCYREENEEMIFCFDLDKSQYLNFEPDKEKLLAGLLFSGVAVAGSEKADLKLPAGNYLFAQKRELLNRNDIIDMAAEIQAEGLWQRLKLGKRLYLRYLYEDGSFVTQLFRPINTD